jgi:hypothetical protein
MYNNLVVYPPITYRDVIYRFLGCFVVTLCHWRAAQGHNFWMSLFLCNTAEDA